MSRALRIEYDHAFYHVMNRGKGRRDIFHDDRYFRAFLDTVAEAQKRFNAVIHCYCLMRNHYHLLIELSREAVDRYIRLKPSAENIVAQLALMFKITSEEITTKSTGRPRANFARKLAIYSCQQLGDMRLGSIASYFNFTSTGSVSACISCMKKKLAEKELKSVYDQLQKNLNVIQYT